MKSIEPDALLLAYRLGVFPMAESREAQEVVWVRPKIRCVLPLDNFHVPKRLARTVRSDRFDVRCDTAFDVVICNCAKAGPQRGESWINPAITNVFEELHRRGHAHSIETWEENELVGGLYGLSIGAAFFGESMFSSKSDASKVALVHLAARLKLGGYRLILNNLVP
jgi:leucyl/phenylalanyl-tRNA--protein transferase